MHLKKLVGPEAILAIRVAQETRFVLIDRGCRVLTDLLCHCKFQDILVCLFLKSRVTCLIYDLLPSQPCPLRQRSCPEGLD